MKLLNKILAGAPAIESRGDFSPKLNESPRKQSTPLIYTTPKSIQSPVETTSSPHDAQHSLELSSGIELNEVDRDAIASLNRVRGLQFKPRTPEHNEIKEIPPPGTSHIPNVSHNEINRSLSTRNNMSGSVKNFDDVTKPGSILANVTSLISSATNIIAKAKSSYPVQSCLPLGAEDTRRRLQYLATNASDMHSYIPSEPMAAMETSMTSYSMPPHSNSMIGGSAASVSAQREESVEDTVDHSTYAPSTYAPSQISYVPPSVHSQDTYPPPPPPPGPPPSEQTLKESYKLSAGEQADVRIAVNSLQRAVESRDPITAKLASIQVGYLSSGSPMKQTALGDLGTPLLLIQLMHITTMDAPVIEEVLHAINCLCRLNDKLSTTNTKNVTAFSNVRFYKLLIEKIIMFQSNVIICERGCIAIRNFSITMDQATNLGLAGACELLVTVFSKYEMNPAIMEKAINAMVALALDFRNVDVLVHAGVIRSLVVVLEDLAVGQHDSIYIAICQFFERVASVINHVNIIQRHEVCEALVTQLELRYNSLEVADSALAVLVKLSLHHSLLGALSKGNLTSVLSSILAAHPNSSPCLQNVCVLVCKLSSHSAENVLALRVTDIYNLLSDGLRRLGSLELDEDVCGAIGWLCGRVKVAGKVQIRNYGDVRACPFIIAALARAVAGDHENNGAAIARCVTRVIAGSSEFQENMGQHGVCPLLLSKCLDWSELYQLDALIAVEHLCVHSEDDVDKSFSEMNAARFVLAGAPSVVEKILDAAMASYLLQKDASQSPNTNDERRRLHDPSLYRDVVEVAFRAMRNLCMFDSSLFIQNVNQCQRFTKVIQKFGDTPAVIVWVLRTLRTAVDQEDSALALEAAEVPAACVGVLGVSRDDVDVCLEVCDVIQMFTSFEQPLASMIEAKVCERLGAILNVHISNEDVVAAACDALRSVLTKSMQPATRARVLSVCPSLVESLRSHPTSTKIIKCTCFIIEFLGRRFAGGSSGSAVWESFTSTQAGALTALLDDGYPDRDTVLWIVKAISTIHAAFADDSSACQSVVKIIKKYTNDADIIMSCCICIRRLCNHSPDNVARVTGADGCVAIAIALQCASRCEREDVTSAAVSALYALASDSPGNCEKLGAAGVCELLMQCYSAAAEWMTSTKALEKLLSCIARLVRPESTKYTVLKNLNRFVELGSISIAVKGLLRHHESTSLARAGCIAVRNLAFDYNIKARLGREMACEALMDALVGHIDDVEITEAALGAVAQLATVPENGSRFNSCGVHEVLIDMLRCHLQKETLCARCLEAMASLTFVDASDDGLARRQRDRLASLDIHELLVAALECHVLSFVVRAPTLLVVGRLAENNQDFREQFEGAGGCEAVCATRIDLLKHSAVAANACYAIANLANGSANNKARLGKADACKLVVSALKAHIMDSEVAKQGCRAIHHLARDDAANSDMLGSLGACETVLTISEYFISKPDSDAVSEAAAEAASSLSSNSEANARKLSVSEACEEVVRVAEKALSSKDTTLALSAAATVLKISQGGPSHLQSLGAAGACEAVVKMLSELPRDTTLVISMIQALAALCRFGTERVTTNVGNLNRISNSGAFEILVDIMKANVNIAEVSRVCSMAISHMAYEKDHQAKLRDLGAPELTLFILKTHMSLPLVVESACRAISNLTSAPSSAVKLVSENAFDLLAQALSLHWETYETVVAICAAIVNCSASCDRDFLVGVKSSDMFESLVKALGLHIASPAGGVVVCLALRALVENMPKKSRAELVSMGVCGALVQFLDANISHPKAGDVTHIITAQANLF